MWWFGKRRSLFVISITVTYLLLSLQLSYHDHMEKARKDFGIDAADFGETRTPFTVAITARAQAVDLAL